MLNILNSTTSKLLKKGRILEKIEGHERRRHKRLKFSESVQFQHRDPSQYGGCLSKDISEGGIRLNFSDFVPIDTELVLSVNLAKDKMIDCMGRVVWVERVPFSEQYHVGIEFTESDSLFDSRQEIHKMIAVYST